MSLYLDNIGQPVIKGDKFRLIGNTTEFIAVHFHMAGGDVPAVTGWTLDGKHMTTARVADTIRLEDA